MFPVVHPGKVQEFLHISADVFSLFPDHSNFYANRRIKGNADDPGAGKFVSHAGIKEAAVFSGFYKLQGRVDLAAAHDDIRRVAGPFRTVFLTAGSARNQR